MAQSQNEELKAAMNAMRKFQWGILAGMDNAFIAKVIDYNERIIQRIFCRLPIQAMVKRRHNT